MSTKNSASFLTVLMVAQAYFLQDVLSITDPSAMSRIRAKILDHYDIYARPVQNHSDATVVYIVFDCNGIEIDESRNLITLHTLLHMSWQDQHIKWNPLDYGNLTEVKFNRNELWTPDISVINNEIDHFGNTLAIALYNSIVWWFPPSKFQVHCPFDFRLWPYDKQACRVIISSWTHHGGEINLVVPEHNKELVNTDSTYFTASREWKLLQSSIDLVHRNIRPNIPLVEIVITVDVQRKYSSHTAAITIVGFGITMAILISFWLDPFAQERLPLTLLILLLNSIYLQYMHRVIPNNGSIVPLPISFFRDSLIMVTFAFTWTVGIRYIAKIKRSASVPLPNFVETFLNGPVATILCLNPQPQSKGQAQKKLQESSEDDHGDVSELVGEDSENIHEHWEWLARFLDRMAFIAYLVAYIIFIAAFL